MGVNIKVEDTRSWITNLIPLRRGCRRRNAHLNLLMKVHGEPVGRAMLHVHDGDFNEPVRWDARHLRTQPYAGNFRALLEVERTGIQSCIGLRRADLTELVLAMCSSDIRRRYRLRLRKSAQAAVPWKRRTKAWQITGLVGPDGVRSCNRLREPVAGDYGMPRPRDLDWWGERLHYVCRNDSLID